MDKLQHSSGQLAKPMVQLLCCHFGNHVTTPIGECLPYSLLKSAKLAGLDPVGYITAAVQGIEMGMDPEALLPLPELFPQATA